jgi:hypothetical protein
VALFCSERRSLELAFLRMCRDRGPDWAEAILRPLKITGDEVNVKSIPTVALRAAYLSFNTSYKPTPGICLR